MNENLTILWNELQKRFAEAYGQEICNQLLNKTKPIELTENNLKVIVVNQLMKSMLLARKSQIEPLLSQITGCSVTLTAEALENDNNISIPVEQVITQSENYNSGFDTNLDKKFRFENFVVGNNCRMAHAAALNVSENPGKGYNPLFIYGKPGLGKTHLIQAIGNRLLEKNPYMKVLYTTTEEFLNNVVNSIHNHATEALHNKYRKLDCLIIDDIQQLKDKEATQEEFFNTFNTLYNSHKQIIIACDRPPQEIKTLEDRITSRLARGILGDIQEPDFETRIAILRVKLEERNIELSPECINLIAASITSDIRLLESICNNIKLYNDMNENITEDLVTQVIKKHVETVKHEGITFEEVLQIVAEYYGLKTEEFYSKRRDAKINTPRQILMYLTRKLTGLTFNEIGKELGGRDHSTIMNGYEKIYSSLLKNDEKIVTAINVLQKKLEK